ncbi:MAG: hypothetical protein K2X99_06760 [Gemmatimonadaceae bacterium]|jgi:hypothetical protein|nr:hypothetical protein [Gemmatimonadaceae bacterium]
MARNDDKSIQNLVKKMQKNPPRPKTEFGKTYDSTAPKRVDEDLDQQKFFKEMKRREF